MKWPMPQTGVRRQESGDSKTTCRMHWQRCGSRFADLPVRTPAGNTRVLQKDRRGHVWLRIIRLSASYPNGSGICLSSLQSHGRSQDNEDYGIGGFYDLTRSGRKTMPPSVVYPIIGADFGVDRILICCSHLLCWILAMLSFSLRIPQYPPSFHGIS